MDMKLMNKDQHSINAYVFSESCYFENCLISSNYEKKYMGKLSLEKACNLTEVTTTCLYTHNTHLLFETHIYYLSLVFSHTTEELLNSLSV